MARYKVAEGTDEPSDEAEGHALRGKYSSEGTDQPSDEAEGHGRRITATEGTDEPRAMKARAHCPWSAVHARRRATGAAW